MSGAVLDLNKLMADCYAQGIQLLSAGDGNLTIDAPRGALTPGLIHRLKMHKAELLAALGHCPDCGGALVESPTFDGFLNNECPACERCFGCRPESDTVAERFKSRGKPVTFVDGGGDAIGEVSACPSCGSPDQWEAMAGDWRCLWCDAPVTGQKAAGIVRTTS